MDDRWDSAINWYNEKCEEIISLINENEPNYEEKQEIKNLFKEKIQITKIQEDIEFALQCKRNKIIPKFLRIKRNKHPAHSNILQQAEKKMLSLHITKLHKKLQNKEIATYEKHIRITKKLKNSTYLNPTMTHFNSKFIQMEMQKSIKSKKIKQKLNWLMKQNNPSNKKEIPLNREEQYINLSKITLTNQEKEILNKGPKFISKQKLNITQQIAEIEDIVEKIPDSEKDKIRKIMYEKQKYKKEDTNHTKTIRQLKNNNQINILMADKNNKIVIIDKEQYEEKAQQALDNLNLETINEDPVLETLKKLNNLRNLKYLPTNIKENSKPPHNPKLPTVFFKIKTHKADQPFRPIVNSKNGPLKNLEKSLVSICKQVKFKQEYNIKSSLEFHKRIKLTQETYKDKDFENNTHMASLDVKNLYPNINRNMVKTIILNYLSKDEIYSRKQIQAIDKAFQLTFNNAYFKYKNLTYKQNSGCAMGSSLAPVLGEIFMTYFENKIFETQKHPLIYTRYVDDIFLMTETKEEINNLYSKFNQLTTNLNFTKEIETNNSINYLDLTVIKEGKNLITKVYHKDNSETSFIPANSEHPPKYKKAGPQSHLRRALTFSENQHRKDEINKIKIAMLKTGYSTQQFYKIKGKIENIMQPKSTLIKISEENTISNEKKKYLPITYQTEHKTIYKRINKILTNNHQLTFKLMPTLFQQIRKDKSYSTNNSGIYAIPIQHKHIHEDKYFYIGQTKRHISFRIDEHRKSIQDNNPYSNSALTNFIKNNKNYQPDFNKFKIITTTKEAQHLEIMESIQITVHKNYCVNEQTSKNIPEFWLDIIKNNRNLIIRKSPIIEELFQNLTGNIQIDITKFIKTPKSQEMEPPAKTPEVADDGPEEAETGTQIVNNTTAAWRT